eukprot:s4405_g4.t1
MCRLVLGPHKTRTGKGKQAEAASPRPRQERRERPSGISAVAMAWNAAEIREWATRECLSRRIAAKAEELEDLGGLQAITDSWLCANGVTLLPARSRALTAAKAALHPKKKAFRLGRRGIMFLEAPDAEVFQRRRPGRQCRQPETDSQVLERRRPHRRVNRNKKESRPLNVLPQRIEEEETDAELGTGISERPTEPASNKKPCFTSTSFSATPPVPSSETSFWWTLLCRTFQVFTPEMAVQGPLLHMPA